MKPTMQPQRPLLHWLLGGQITPVHKSSPSFVEGPMTDVIFILQSAPANPLLQSHAPELLHTPWFEQLFGQLSIRQLGPGNPGLQ
jgi:hypothetical protein